VEEIIIASERNLSKDVVYKLADTSFVKRHENIIITGATGCGKTGRLEPFYCHGLGLSSLPNGL
jgi:HrpA-like RNA helicase